MNDNSAPIIDVRRVVKTFPVGENEITVLRGLSLCVHPGEFVSVVGPSGNGKSTLLNMITGIDHPTSGEVFVNGKAIHLLNENQLAAWRNTDVGIVFQFFQLLPSLNLVQNIMLPMEFAAKLKPKDRREQAMCLLEMVGLKDQWRKLPSQVSGGQQQRAAIARALANQPPLIVADEPTGNLDATTSEVVFDLFCRLASQGTTLVMVTHNEELARQAPRTVSVINGQIAGDERRIPNDGPCVRRTGDHLSGTATVVAKELSEDLKGAGTPLSADGVVRPAPTENGGIVQVPVISTSRFEQS